MDFMVLFTMHMGTGGHYITMIGQYPQHMTLCPPVSIVKRCCGYATNMGIVRAFLYSLISPKWQLFYIYVQFGILKMMTSAAHVYIDLFYSAGSWRITE